MKPGRSVFAFLVPLTLATPLCLAQLQPGDPAPDFCEPDTAWVSRCLSDFQGNCVLLTFWEST